MAMQMWTVPHRVHVMVHTGAVGCADDAMLRHMVQLSSVSLLSDPTEELGCLGDGLMIPCTSHLP